MTNTMLILTFAAISQNLHLPPGLLSALCFVESRHKTTAINVHDGGSPSYGVCQIKYETAVGLGYTGSKKALKRPETNILWAGRYLKFQLRRYSGDPRKAVAAYNAGSHRENRRGLTKNRKYVSKVFKAWAEDR